MNNNLNWRETDPNNPQKYKEDLKLYAWQHKVLKQLYKQHSVLIPRGSGRSRDYFALARKFLNTYNTNEGERSH